MFMTRSPWSGSVEDDAAVHVEGLAGDVARGRRGQEDREAGEVVRLVRPAERDHRVAPAPHLLDGHALVPGACRHVGLRERGNRDAGADRVDVDIVPGELERGGGGRAPGAGGPGRGRGPGSLGGPPRPRPPGRPGPGPGRGPAGGPPRGRGPRRPRPGGGGGASRAASARGRGGEGPPAVVV